MLFGFRLVCNCFSICGKCIVGIWNSEVLVKILLKCVIGRFSCRKFWCRIL